MFLVAYVRNLFFAAVTEGEPERLPHRWNLITRGYQ